MVSQNMIWGHLVVFVCVSVGIAAQVEPYCKPRTPLLGQPSLPKLDLDAFVIKYRASIIDKSYTMLAMESYDKVNNKVRMDYQVNGTEASLILDYGANKYIDLAYIAKDKTSYECVIQALDKTKSDNFDMFGFRTTKGKSGKSIPHIVSSQEVLMFASSSNPIYQGAADLDGLAVDHWHSCLTWKDVDAVFTLDYYFTTPDQKHHDPLTPSQVPVRAVVRGDMRGQNGGRRSFHHVYEYLEFKAYTELPVETFNVPEFMSCTLSAGVEVEGIPSIPESMSYTVEKVIHSGFTDKTKESVTVEVATVHHDTKRKLIRVDEMNTISISDFNTGLEYVIGNYDCETRPIHPDNVESARIEDGIVKIADRSEIKYFRHNFQKTGQLQLRGIQANTFASVANVNNDEKVAAFMNRRGSKPLGLKVVNRQQSLKTFYNIFNFFGKPKGLRGADPFDIRECRKANEVTDFEIVFSLESKDVVLTESYVMLFMDHILLSLKDTISHITNVSPLQISFNDYRITDAKQLHWLGSFLDADPSQARAKVEKEIPLKSSNSIYNIIQSAINDGMFFTSFTKEEDGISLKVTPLSIQPASSVLSLAIHSDIMYKFHTSKDKCIVSFTNPHVNLRTDTAHDCAQACIDSHQVDCNIFQYTPNTHACQFGWEASVPDVIATPGCDSYVLRYLDSFEVSPGVVFEGSAKAIHADVSLPEDCAKLCLQEKTFDCHSFELCAEGNCLLHENSYFKKRDMSSRRDNAVSVSCSRYTRKSLDDFHLTKNTALTFPGENKLVVSNHNECAYLCSNDEIGCSIFSTCVDGDSIVCTLVPQSQTKDVTFSKSSNCEVYKSRKNSESSLQPPGSAEPKRRGSAERIYRSPSSKSGGYSGAAMAGLAVGMVLTGICIGALAVFLLRRFTGWEGFK